MADSWVVVGLDNGGNKNNATVLDATGEFLVKQLYERPSRGDGRAGDRGPGARRVFRGHPAAHRDRALARARRRSRHARPCQRRKRILWIFFSQFNMDVLAKMVGEAAKKPNGINTINASLADCKNRNKNKPEYWYQPILITFEKNNVNQFPTGWNGMKNITVQQYENKKWLALTKDGYWYPQAIQQRNQRQFQSFI